MSVLEFDSKWFGVKVGRHDGDPEEADIWAKAVGLDCLFTLLPLAQIGEVHWAAQNGFKVVDVKVEFVAKTSQQTLLRRSEKEDIEAVKQLAYTAFRKTRFHNDRRFDHHRINAMYTNWVLTSGATIYVADGDHGFAGFVLVGQTHLELIAVEPGSRGQGHGLALTRSALGHAYENEQDKLRVVTQGGNHAAQRTFQAAGFTLENTSLWLHKWYR